MSGPILHAVELGLQPSVDDSRLVRLGKRAALLLISRDEPISRATLCAASKEVESEPGRRKPGFSEASLRTNAGLRRVYRLARSMPARSVVRRRGKVAAHILRMTKAEIAISLVVGRMAALEREEEHRLAMERLGIQSAAPAVERARIERDALAVNVALDGVRHRPAAADLRIAVSRANADAVGRATAWAERQGIRPTSQWLAARCGLHPGTVERMAMAASAKEAIAKTFGFEVPLPPSLMRYRKWDLGRALHVERTYIRALHDATMTIAAVVIEREQQERRAAVRAAQVRDAVL
ncbi:hypothetical protein KX816_04495 [Sphingosinicellaceae bacterium]|nr:hypothetical protein KX816_04495 [Sphingosinicellaceae bacterium]